MMMPVNPVTELVLTQSEHSSHSLALTHHSHDASHPQPSPRARLDTISARVALTCPHTPLLFPLLMVETASLSFLRLYSRITQLHVFVAVL
eukprot:674280-Rhodomonas_salina.1